MIVRSGFSFRCAAGHITDVVDRAKECGWSSVALTDRSSTYGFVDFTKACKKAGLRPVYGVELAIVPERGAAKPIIDYWRFIAKDSIRPINELIWQATSESEGRGRTPALLYNQAIDARGVYKVTGERALLSEFSPAEDLFVSLSPSVSRGFYRTAAAAGHQFCATSDNYYPRAGDKEFYRVLIGMNSSTQTYPMHVLDDQEWLVHHSKTASVEDCRAALANRDLILEGSTAKLERAELLVAEKPRTLRQMCLDGAARLGVDLNDVYSERIDRELKMIEEKNFQDYFYIIADMVIWARERMIVGPARGSSCGSLVCYLLGITTVDPIPYGLIFERFIDVNRADLPDIDIDFSDARRHLVFEYMERKYGWDHVARLGSVGTFMARSALRQAGISLRIPDWRTDKLADSIVKRMAGDSRAAQTIEDTLTGTDPGRELMAEFPEIMVVTRMEGHPSNAGQHAAGVVLTERPMTDHVAIDARTGAIMADKKDAEELNLLKIDALGLTQLSIFERCLDLIGVSDHGSFLLGLPLDDQAAFDVFNRGHFSGVFQFNGASVQTIAKKTGVHKFSDIVDITALARPGPLASGGTDDWIRRRVGEAEVEYPDPMIEPYVSDTLGIMIYQEQVMRIGREIGDLSWGEVSELRRAMSRSLGVEFFSSFGDKWVAGAIRKGLAPERARAFWLDMCEFGAMGFNKAHSVGYGYISYWCAWLKAHHPMEFAAATLDADTGDAYKQIKTLRELRDEGIDYVPIDPLHSGDRWEIAERDSRRVLVGPLSQVHGVGPKTVAEILSCRRRGEPLRASVAKKLDVARTEIDSLYPVADAVGDPTAHGIETRPTPIRDVKAGDSGSVVIIGIVDVINPSDVNSLPKVAARGGRVLSGPSMALNMFVHDDSDEMLCRIDRKDYERLARPIIDRGRAGKVIYAFKGTVPRDFRMLSVKQYKLIKEL